MSFGSSGSGGGMATSIKTAVAQVAEQSKEQSRAYGADSPATSLAAAQEEEKRRGALSKASQLLGTGAGDVKSSSALLGA